MIKIPDDKKMKETMSKLEESLSGLDEVLKPLLNFTNLAKDINKLKDIMPDNITHGEKESFPLQEIVVELVESTPNDAELGEAVRQLYNKHQAEGSFSDAAKADEADKDEEADKDDEAEEAEEADTKE